MSTNIDYAGKTVLITGGTGSFGRTMAEHLLKTDIAAVRIFSRDEAKQHDMRIEFADERLDFHIGDIRDPHSIGRAMSGVQLVFHAAALKQVPSCEFFPEQAVLTNVVGSTNVLDAAKAAGVESVVCLSTDKAVLPVNAMGMTKALMEKVMQAAARANDAGTIVSAVRYGNVLYSRGSVVPLFVQQALAEQPMTITDPEMTRFLMPLRHCVDLVEFAFFNAEPGDVFIRKAPASTVADLAQGVNAVLGTNAPIEIIGARHGEKLYETLATADELARSEDMGDYLRVRMDSRGLNYADYHEHGNPSLDLNDDYHSHNCERLDVDQVATLLQTLPEIQDVAASGVQTS